MSAKKTGRTVVKHFSWAWSELPGPDGAAWSEEWRYDGAGRLVSRTRIGLAKKADAASPTISTDPRAGAIMREEIGRHPAGRPMGGPHW